MTQNTDFLNFKGFTGRKQNQTLTEWSYGLRTLSKTCWYCWIRSPLWVIRVSHANQMKDIQYILVWWAAEWFGVRLVRLGFSHCQVCFASSVVTDCSLPSVSVCSTRRASWLLFLSSYYCLRQAVWGEFSTDEHTQLNNSWSHCTVRASRAKKEDVGAILITFQASYGRLFHPWYTDTQPLGECLFFVLGACRFLATHYFT